MPIELPGAREPPFSVILPKVPLPPSAPPELTVIPELAMEPFTTSSPSLTIVAP